MPHDDEYVHLEKYLESLGRANVDALICADLGTISLAREMLPDIPIHVSTQAGVTNARAAEAYLRLGCRRVIFSPRADAFSEIKELRRRCSRELGLEVFVHGSMCVAYSGRCLLSNYLTGRDATAASAPSPAAGIIAFDTSSLRSRSDPACYTGRRKRVRHICAVQP